MFSAVQFSSVQFKMVSMRSGRPICAPPPSLRGVSPKVALETNSSSVVGLIDDGPFSSSQGRSGFFVEVFLFVFLHFIIPNASLY